MRFGRLGTRRPSGDRGADEPSLASGTAWIFGSQAVRLVFQTVYFLVVARVLGASSFGALAAATALVALLAPFSAWGAGNIMVMEVSVRPAIFRESYGSGLLSIAASSALLIPLAVGVGAIVLPSVPVAAIVLLATADLLFGRVVDLAAAAFQSMDRFAATGAFGLLTPGARSAAALAFATLAQDQTLLAWTIYYLAGTVVSGVIAAWYVHRELGGPIFRRDAMKDKLRLGGYFAVSQSASTVYADIDKTMLARLSTLDATGIYAAADRAVRMTFIPFVAMLTAAYPRFFRAGAGGISQSTRYARSLLGVSVAYGAIAGAAIFAFAPLAPDVLGSDYSASVEAMRWLAPMPLLSILYYLPADALTGAASQGVRTLLQVGAAALNVAMNLVLIPSFSWRGAAWATLTSVAALAVALWIATIVQARRERSAAGPTTGAAYDSGTARSEPVR